MTPNDIGSILALTEAGIKVAEVYPEEFQAAGNTGAIGGGVLGALGGGALGNQIARHIGKATRQKHMLIPIPGTGLGESFFNYSKGPVVGEALGAMLGGAAGAGLGHQGAQLAALRRGGAPHRLARDPRLMQYMQEPSQG